MKRRKTLLGNTPAFTLPFTLPLLAILMAVVVIFIAREEDETSTAQPFPFQPPEKSAELFFPDVLTSHYRTHSALAYEEEYGYVWLSVFTPEAGRFHQSMMRAKLEKGIIGTPEPMPLGGEASCGGPLPSRDGSRLYFNMSVVMEVGTAPVQTLWYAYRDDSEWSDPVQLEIPLVGSYIGSQFTFGPEPGSLIVTMRPDGGSNDLFLVSHLQGDDYAEPVALPPQVNSPAMEADPWYDPITKTLVFFSHGREDSFGAGDIYASRYRGEGEWSEAVNLGALVNTGGFERFPSVSPDGNALFFVRENEESGKLVGGYYWISMATVLDGIMTE